MADIDVLVVGAGPAGLATAIRLGQRLQGDGRDASVVVIDKAAAPGYHNLSGAVVEPGVLDELLPDWRTDRTRFADHVTPVERDELWALSARHAVRVPPRAVPPTMRHAGDAILSVSRLVAFLADRADRLGVEVYHGFAARGLLIEDRRVRGVRLVDLGLDAAGRPRTNYLPGEEVRAGIVVVADGSRGVLSAELDALDRSVPEASVADDRGSAAGRAGSAAGHRTAGRGAGARDVQVYGLGVKAVLQFPGGSPLGAGRVVHTIGYPTRRGVFGGGFIYGMGPKTVAVGLLLGLDWRFVDLDPRVEYEAFRSHPFVAALLEGGTSIATGARTVPEGGYYALGPLDAGGALLVGDAAGFVDEARLKGVHTAIRSGMCAGDAIADALSSDAGVASAGARYRGLLAERGILDELRRARNYRQGFRWGLVPGAALSLIGGRLPVHLRMPPDRSATRVRAHLDRRLPAGADGSAFVSLTGTAHREDEPSHVALADPARCVACGTAGEAACTHFCPGEVYRWTGAQIVVSASNCLHCMTCTVKCPADNIRWVPPEGGEGPRYRQL